MSNSEPLLSMANIHKSFPGVKALDSVDFKLYEGEIAGLVGENGAGKSTLMNILTGVMQPDKGTIYLDNETVKFEDNLDARDKGIAYIHQELNLIEELPIMENLFLGDQPAQKLGIVNFQHMYKESKQVLKTLNLDLAPGCLVENLPLAKKQMVEIAKALLYEAKVVVMDEPTSSLAEEEIALLFELIKNLKAEGKSIIFISHRLEEIFEITDRVTVLRNGFHIATHRTENLDHNELVTLMAGKEVEERFFKKETEVGEEIFSVKNLTGDMVNNVDMQVKAGELVGIAGLMGSGRTEFLEMLFGIEPIEEGSLKLNGDDFWPKSVPRAMKKGLAYLPDDRSLKGLFLDFDLLKNIYISTVEKKEFIANEKKAEQPVQELIDRLDIVTPSVREKIKNLSGGNRQKTILARWMMAEMDLLLVNEPTRGIDVNAKTEIYKFLFELNEKGAGIIMVSSELPEILTISDRILVMYEGEIYGEFSRQEANQEKLMKAMTGSKVAR